MNFLERVCSAFNSAKLSYAVVGGHAVALHGAVRGTVDIDFVINWNKKTIVNAERTLNSIGLESRLPINAEDVFLYQKEYIENRNLIAWSFYNPKDLSEQVDILINYDLSGEKTDSIVLANAKVQVLKISSLIRMKKASGRPQDLEDVAALEQLL